MAGGSAFYELEYRKISQTEGGFTGDLADQDAFGSVANSIGDLDGDEIPELAVSAIWDEDKGTLVAHGSVWILFLNSDASVRRQVKLEPGTDGVPAVSGNPANFGEQLAPLGDLDGDGVPDLAVGQRFDSSVWILFLDRGGRVRSHKRVGPEEAGVTLDYLDFVPSSLLSLGDADGDGLHDLVVGGVTKLYFLTLDRSGNVVSSKVTTAEELGTREVGTVALLGAVAPLGDLDGDGTADIAVGHALLRLESGGGVRELTWLLDPFFLMLDRYAIDVAHPASLGDLDGDGVNELALSGTRWRSLYDYETALFVLYLDRNGRVASHRKLGTEAGGLSARVRGLGAVSRLGDIDGDGSIEVAFGAPTDGDGGPGRGAVWIVSMHDPTKAPSTSTTTIAPVTSTTTELVTTTTLTCSPEYCGGQDGGVAYDVELRLGATRALGALQFRIEYDIETGYFVGGDDQVRCTLEGHNAVFAFNDCDAASHYCRPGNLTVGFISMKGVPGPTVLSTCSFRYFGASLDADDFAVTIDDATGPNLRPVDLRTVDVVALPLPAAE